MDYQSNFGSIWNDKPSTLTTVIGRIVMSLIIGSIYFGYYYFAALWDDP